MKKTKEDDGFEKKFKEMIKSVIEEEGYIKKEDMEKDSKLIVESILDQIDSIISRHVKIHLVELAQCAFDKFSDKKENELTK